MSHRDHRGRRGFTRIELFVVLIVSAGLLMLAAPKIHRWRIHGDIELARYRGQRLYSSMIWPVCDSPSQLAVEWPKSADVESGRYRDSTDLFTSLVESNVIEGYEFFATPFSGIPRAKSKAEFRDGELHNMWCVALGELDRMKSRAPVIFTQNFKFQSDGSSATQNQMIGLELGTQPYEGKIGVVVQRSGESFTLNGNTTLLTNFNPHGATNGFLWPLASGQDVSDR